MGCSNIYFLLMLIYFHSLTYTNLFCKCKWNRDKVSLLLLWIRWTLIKQQTPSLYLPTIHSQQRPTIPPSLLHSILVLFILFVYLSLFLSSHHATIPTSLLHGILVLFILFVYPSLCLSSHHATIPPSLLHGILVLSFSLYLSLYLSLSYCQHTMLLCHHHYYMVFWYFHSLCISLSLSVITQCYYTNITTTW